MVHCRRACALPGEQVTICLCRGPRIQVGALGLQNKPGLTLMEHTSQAGEMLKIFTLTCRRALEKKHQLIVQLAQWRRRTRNASISTPESWSSQSACPSSTVQKEGDSHLLPAGKPSAARFLSVSDLATRKVGKVLLLALILHYLQMALKRKKYPRQSRPGSPHPLTWSASAHDSHQDSMESNFSV